MQHTVEVGLLNEDIIINQLKKIIPENEENRYYREKYIFIRNDNGKLNYIKPDLIIVTKEKVFVIEIKEESNETINFNSKRWKVRSKITGQEILKNSPIEQNRFQCTMLNRIFLRETDLSIGWLQGVIIIRSSDKTLNKLKDNKYSKNLCDGGNRGIIIESNYENISYSFKEMLDNLPSRKCILENREAFIKFLDQSESIHEDEIKEYIINQNLEIELNNINVELNIEKQILFKTWKKNWYKLLNKASRFVSMTVQTVNRNLKKLLVLIVVILIGYNLNTILSFTAKNIESWRELSTPSSTSANSNIDQKDSEKIGHEFIVAQTRQQVANKELVLINKDLFDELNLLEGQEIKIIGPTGEYIIRPIYKDIYENQTLHNDHIRINSRDREYLKVDYNNNYYGYTKEHFETWSNSQKVTIEWIVSE